MWPWEHAVVGYVACTILVVVVRRRPLTTREAVVVVFGTQIPDLVDKPLAWSLSVLPSGRSFGHSLLTWVVVATVVAALANRFDRRELSWLLLVGYLVGILTDVSPTALAGDLGRATFLVWPLLPPPAHDGEPSFLAHAAQIGVADVVQLLLLVAVFVVGHAVLRTVPGEREFDSDSR